MVLVFIYFDNVIIFSRLYIAAVLVGLLSLLHGRGRARNQFMRPRGIILIFQCRDAPERFE